MTLEEIDRKLAYWRRWLEKYEGYYEPDTGVTSSVPIPGEAYAAIRQLVRARARCVAGADGAGVVWPG